MVSTSKQSFAAEPPLAGGGLRREPLPPTPPAVWP